LLLAEKLQEGQKLGFSPNGIDLAPCIPSRILELIGSHEPKVNAERQPLAFLTVYTVSGPKVQKKMRGKNPYVLAASFL
jgi:hypothetical protein